MPINRKLKTTLIEMMERDQKMRKSDRFDVGVDKKNIEKLKEIIDKHDWPTISLVGKKASNAAWLIAQHADRDIPFQKKCLQLITKALDQKEVRPSNFAYLTDRVLTNTGKPQVFGTQFRFNEKTQQIEPKQIEDLDTVDERRKAYDLKPSTLAEYLQSAERHLRKE